MTFKGFTGSRLGHRHTHTDYFDDTHKVEVWEDYTGNRYFIPLFLDRKNGKWNSKDGGSWSAYSGPYKPAPSSPKGIQVFDTYGAAGRFILRSLKRR